MSWRLLPLVLILSACVHRPPAAYRRSVVGILRHAGLEATRDLQSMPPFRLPLARTRIESRFGNRDGKAHEGLDLNGRAGETVFAAAEGKVIFAADDIDGYGYTVILLHEGGYATLYAHASDLLVVEGDRVLAGQAIARVGDSGNASGPHLHFEIRRGLEAIDPAPILFPKK